MFRITRTEIHDGTLLKLEGRLADRWVDELSDLTNPLMYVSPVTLDLSGLTFIDTRGVLLLQELDGRGARLVGGSTFVTALLGKATL